jgi:hypothetical protein
MANFLSEKINLDEFSIKPFFWNNTKFILNVEKSNILNSGNGIFSYQNIPKETLIGYYEGILKDDDGSCVGDYSFSLNKRWYIDARSYPRSYIAMINDAHGSKFKNNCEFRMELEDPITGKKRKPHERKVTLWSIKNIKAGQELYADYGTDYWTCERFS